MTRLSALFIVAGTYTLAFHALAGKPPEPVAPSATPSEQPQRPEARKDRYGDPLPGGAIARLGTMRLRREYAFPSSCDLAFTADGKALASARNDKGV